MAQAAMQIASSGKRQEIPTAISAIQNAQRKSLYASGNDRNCNENPLQLGDMHVRLQGSAKHTIPPEG